MSSRKIYLSIVSAVLFLLVILFLYFNGPFFKGKEDNLIAKTRPDKQQYFCGGEAYDPVTNTCCESSECSYDLSDYNFIESTKKIMTIGSSGSDVGELQMFLVSQGFLVMPAGLSTGYFGALTQAALAKYQAANGIAPAAGYFGPMTISVIKRDLEINNNCRNVSKIIDSITTCETKTILSRRSGGSWPPSVPQGQCNLSIHGAGDNPWGCWSSGSGHVNTIYDNSYRLDWQGHSAEEVVAAIEDVIQQMIDNGCSDIKIAAHSAGGFYLVNALNGMDIPSGVNVDAHTIASPLLGYQEAGCYPAPPDWWCDSHPLSVGCGLDDLPSDGGGIDWTWHTTYTTQDCDDVICPESQPTQGSDNVESICASHCGVLNQILPQI